MKKRKKIDKAQTYPQETPSKAEAGKQAAF